MNNYDKILDYTRKIMDILLKKKQKLWILIVLFYVI